MEEQLNSTNLINEVTNEETEQIKKAIKEIAFYDYKYKNQYLKLERGLSFTPTEEETKKYIENVNFLKNKKVFNEREEFVRCNGSEERQYYMHYCLESDLKKNEEEIKNDENN